MSWAHYLLQVNIYLIIFYCFYKLLLDKETYFILNRVYLVSSGIFSLAIPFLRFELFSKKVVSDTLYISVSEINTVVSNYAILPQTQEQYDWGRLIVIIYLIGFLVFFINFVYQLFAVSNLFSKADNNNAFSFFNKKSVSANLPEHATVDLHEDIHIKQLHTVDVIFFEILAIITWFNPVIYFYKKSIKNIHEYLADEAAANFQGDKELYSLLLLSHAFGVKPNNLTNGFLTKSMIKKRIYMLHKERSKKTAVLKYGLFVPLFAIALTLSSASIRKNDSLLAVADKIPLNQVNSVVENAWEAPLSVVNLGPPPAPTTNVIVSENLTNAGKIDKNTLWTGFFKHLTSAIKYPAEAVKKNLQGSTIITFSVKKGQIVNVNVPQELGEGLDEEVVNQINTFNGYVEKDGNYSLKVNFNLPEESSPSKNENISFPDGFTPLQTISIVGFLPKEQPLEPIYAFHTMEVPAEYPGGIAKFYEFLSKSIKYPELATENNIQGTVYTSFTIEKDGTLSDIKIDRRLGYGTDEEALRVLKLSDQWNPGVQNGRTVRVRYNIPIKFALKNVENKIAMVAIKSKGNSDPLVMVDNEVKDLSIIAKLETNSIKSVDVVKAPISTALYGKSAENGAVIITSKKIPKPAVTLVNRN
ncbi:MAG: TonB family protein [Pedobacter sp.]|nr:MAG: TonB family protein [Pedobacter sp.]